MSHAEWQSGVAAELPQLLTQPECALLLRCSTRTVRRLAAIGRLKTVRVTPGSRPLVTRAEILRVLDEGMQP